MSSSGQPSFQPLDRITSTSAYQRGREGRPLALSQLVYAPVFNVYFFSAQSLLSGAGWDETLQRLQRTLPVSIVNSAKIWPAVSAFMFLYIDPAFRAIFAGTIALGWQTYLSWLNQMAARETAEKMEGKMLA
ncbi:hypothetical protein McanMca71_006907 [Microsporum canis]